MNDYELIYLIQNHQDGVALDVLFKKYDKLIWKYIHLYQVPKFEHQDFHQEGMLMLYKAAKTFNEDKKKTFTRYFELILKRHFWKLIKKLPKYVLKEEVDLKDDSYIKDSFILHIDLDLKSDIEKLVFETYYKKGYKIKEIAQLSGYSRKQIYNAIYRIKDKLSKIKHKFY